MAQSNRDNVFNREFLGEEPPLSDKLTTSSYINALNYYNSTCDNKDARTFIDNFLMKNGRKDEASRLARVPDTWIPRTAGWITRLIERGVTFPDPKKTVEFLEKQIKETMTHVEEEKNSSSLIRNKKKSNEIIGMLEERIDQGKDFVVLDWLKENEIASAYCPFIVAKFEPILQELQEAQEGEDEQLEEAYAHLSEDELESLIVFYTALIDDASSYGEMVKKVRKPRKKKVITPEKQIKNLKFQERDKEMNLVSIDPKKIIGASDLWTYNTRYKLLTVLRSIDSSGLKVKGTSIIGYDEKTSETKRTGRKSDHFVKAVLTGGKVALRKIMSESKYDALLGHRINENTILLRVVS